MSNNSSFRELDEAKASPRQVREILLRLMRLIARSISQELSHSDKKPDVRNTGQHRPIGTQVAVDGRPADH